MPTMAVVIGSPLNSITRTTSTTPVNDNRIQSFAIWFKLPGQDRCFNIKRVILFLRAGGFGPMKLSTVIFFVLGLAIGGGGIYFLHSRGEAPLVSGPAPQPVRPVRSASALGRIQPAGG